MAVLSAPWRHRAYELERVAVAQPKPFRSDAPLCFASSLLLAGPWPPFSLDVIGTLNQQALQGAVFQYRNRLPYPLLRPRDGYSYLLKRKPVGKNFLLVRSLKALKRLLTQLRERNRQLMQWCIRVRSSSHFAPGPVRSGGTCKHRCSSSSWSRRHHGCSSTPKFLTKTRRSRR